MNVFKITVFSALLLFSAAFVGCGGGGAKMETTTTTVTLGKQLMDLDKAHKEGVMSDKEYSKAKKTLLDKYK